jgi:hypothetical protein
VPAALVLYAHAGYPLALLALRRLRPAPPPPAPPADLPGVSLIVAAHDEEEVIAAKVRDALGQEYPRDRLEVIVASDGSTDATVRRAREAGADVVLDLPRGGKVRAQDAGVERARHDILAFSDANARWAPDALGHLVAPFSRPDTGYACGLVRFVGGDGTNQEGVYWRYETWVRGLESGLGGVTAGNGAIYAVRRAAYRRVDPRVSHDLSLPFALVKDGWRAVFESRARAEEEMAPSLEGEWRRKRRMMAHAWPMVLGGGLLDPRGYRPLYALQVLSHRGLRYLSPFLHLAALGASLRRGRAERLALLAQAVLVAAAALAPRFPLRPLRLARYYVLMTAAVAAGLWDYARAGTPAEWDRPEGTR